MSIKKRTFDIYTSFNTQGIATAIASKWVEWDGLRTKWASEHQEILQYLFATDTSEIMSQSNEYSNTTHVPKITQIRDLLITYYLESLFSLSDYVEYQGANPDDDTLKKRTAIQRFAQSQLDKSNFKETIRKLVEDYVDCGNAFSIPVWETDFKHNLDGSQALKYEGLNFIRINPTDIVFNPSAASFKDTPKIIRSVLSIGEVKKLAEDGDEQMKKVFKQIVDNRKSFREAVSRGDEISNNISQIAGFDSLTSYYLSDVVELLTFYGTMYDISEDKLYDNKKITVVDRCYLLAEEDLLDINGGNYIQKTSWRDLKDNLWGMSPLANILGMQYRIDFLENKRADIFNFISDPITVIVGEVTSPEYLGPGAEYRCDTDGSVRYLHPDTTALQADLYIDRYMMQMEEMVGAPKEAAGFRTPGEKTAFEYQQMVNAATRVFNRQIKKFEEEMFEPMIKCGIELTLMKKAGQTVTFKTFDYGLNVDEFVTLNIEELQGDGTLRALGSANYADRNTMAQSLMQLGNSALFMSPEVLANISPDVLAKIFCYVTGLDKYTGLYRKDSRLYDQIHQQNILQKGMALLQEEAQTLSTISEPGDEALTEADAELDNE